MNVKLGKKGILLATMLSVVVLLGASVVLYTRYAVIQQEDSYLESLEERISELSSQLVTLTEERAGLDSVVATLNDEIISLQDELERLLAVQPTTTKPVPESLPLGTVEVSGEECPGARCMTVVITCPEIPDAAARLRVTGNGSTGTILLTTGGSGGGLYSKGGEVAEEMMSTLVDDGYLLVEVAWRSPGIWEGPAGSITLACRFPTVAHWVHENLHQGGLFAAQGNSGGSAQIAFSLAYYGLDEILDLANLGGGPPPCPLYKDGQVQKQLQSACLLTILGGPGVGAEWAEPILSGNPRLHYPNTVVQFFLGEDEPSPEIVATAYAYFDAITSAKSMQILPETGHGVHRSAGGAEALITSIKEAAATIS
ncbi:MAG: hypothetical protein ACE5KH_00045 [Candidatus Geothermarchaeales archaeon]